MGWRDAVEKLNGFHMLRPEPEQNGCYFVDNIFKYVCIIDVQKVGHFDHQISNRPVAQIP